MELLKILFGVIFILGETYLLAETVSPGRVRFFYMLLCIEATSFLAIFLVAHIYVR